jgi:hypothetical protein
LRVSDEQQSSLSIGVHERGSFQGQTSDMSRIGGRFGSGMLPPDEFGIRDVCSVHRWKLTITGKPPLVSERGPKIDSYWCLRRRLRKQRLDDSSKDFCEERQRSGAGTRRFGFIELRRMINRPSDGSHS